jgi:hypothetical protein
MPVSSLSRNTLVPTLMAALIVGCAWESEPEEPTVEPGLEHPGGGIEPGTLGPGTGGAVAYPAGPYGRSVGSVIQNFKFTGFKNPKASNYVADENSMVTIQLSDYYNPAADRGKTVALLVNASARWCSVCKEEARQSMIHYPHWRERGVEFMTSIFEDDDAQPAKFTDIEYWGQRYELEYPLVLDPKLTLGVFFNKSASPFNMIIDTRTMTIAFATEGLIDLGPSNPTLQTLTAE